jgi:hypothetical protein
MAHYVAFTNDSTGAKKRVKAGFSWVLFFFSGFLGIPLFLRGLHKYGLVMLAFFLLLFFLGMVNEEIVEAWSTPIRGLGFGLSGMFGLYGNKFTAQHLLENGWSVTNAEEPATTAALEKWSLA